METRPTPRRRYRCTDTAVGWAKARTDPQLSPIKRCGAVPTRRRRGRRWEAQSALTSKRMPSGPASARRVTCARRHPRAMAVGRTSLGPRAMSIIGRVGTARKSAPCPPTGIYCFHALKASAKARSPACLFPWREWRGGCCCRHRNVEPGALLEQLEIALFFRVPVGEADQVEARGDLDRVAGERDAARRFSLLHQDAGNAGDPPAGKSGGSLNMISIVWVAGSPLSVCGGTTRSWRACAPAPRRRRAPRAPRQPRTGRHRSRSADRRADEAFAVGSAGSSS